MWEIWRNMWKIWRNMWITCRNMWETWRSTWKTWRNMWKIWRNPSWRSASRHSGGGGGGRQTWRGALANFIFTTEVEHRIFKDMKHDLYFLAWLRNFSLAKAKNKDHVSCLRLVRSLRQTDCICETRRARNPSNSQSIEENNSEFF